MMCENNKDYMGLYYHLIQEIRDIEKYIQGSLFYPHATMAVFLFVLENKEKKFNDLSFSNFKDFYEKKYGFDINTDEVYKEYAVKFYISIKSFDGIQEISKPKYNFGENAFHVSK